MEGGRGVPKWPKYLVLPLTPLFRAEVPHPLHLEARVTLLHLHARARSWKPRDSAGRSNGITCANLGKILRLPPARCRAGCAGRVPCYVPAAAKGAVPHIVSSADGGRRRAHRHAGATAGATTIYSVAARPTERVRREPLYHDRVAFGIAEDAAVLLLYLEALLVVLVRAALASSQLLQDRLQLLAGELR